MCRYGQELKVTCPAGQAAAFTRQSHNSSKLIQIFNGGFTGTFAHTKWCMGVTDPNVTGLPGGVAARARRHLRPVSSARANFVVGRSGARPGQRPLPTEQDLREALRGVLSEIGRAHV